MNDLKIENTSEFNLNGMYDAVSSLAIIVKTDVTGVICYVNDNFCQISGYTREESIGKTHQLINANFHDKNFFMDLWSTITSNKKWFGEICNQKKDGTIYWVETAITQIYDANGHICNYVALSFDISQRKKAEFKLFQTNKMNSLSEMASGVGHEINNPLAIIVGKSNRIQRLLDDSEKNKQELHQELHKESEFIKNMALRIASIVKGLLTFSRASEKDSPIWTHAKIVVAHLLDLCRERVKARNIDLIAGEIGDIAFECNENLVIQALLNLVNNAIDAVKNLNEAERWIKVTVEESAANRVQFSIYDAGPGIPDSISSKIMQPFFTTKPVGQGVGLGLSASLGIAELHGGSLFLDKTSVNTRFVLDFPLRQRIPPNAT